jgi:hypothetical protein
MRKALTLGAVLAVALGLSAVAAAAPPQKGFVDLSFPDATCPGIDTFSLHGGILIHTLTPTEELQTFQNLTIAWSGNGKTLTSRGPASARITYSDAAHTSVVRSELRGLLVAVTLPGRGAVFLETGLLVEAGPFPGSPVILRHGPDGFRSPEEFDAFCAYFES